MIQWYVISVVQHRSQVVGLRKLMGNYIQVPPICATGFVDRLRKSQPHVPVLLSLQPGDHGFEVMHTSEDEWVQEGLSFIKDYWN